VVASALAVLALVGAVTAILMITTRSTTSRLEGEIGTLNGRLGSARRQLLALQAGTGRLTAQGLDLKGDVRRLGARVAGLQRTVAGLQNTTSLAQEQATVLRGCVPQLQQELAGLSLRTVSVKGHVTSPALSDAAALSPACRAVLSGL
jgi:hypothetical protein